MTEIYWDFYISFAAASLSDVVKNPVHKGAKSIMKSYLYIYYSYNGFMNYFRNFRSMYQWVLKNHSAETTDHYNTNATS